MKKLLTIILALTLIVSCGKTKKAETAPAVDTTTVVDTTAAVETPAVVEPAKTVSWRVIVGAFKAEWRADKWVEKMNNDGYTAGKYLSSNGYYMVYIKSEDNKKKAVSIMLNARNCATEHAWVHPE